MTTLASILVSCNSVSSSTLIVTSEENSSSSSSMESSSFEESSSSSSSKEESSSSIYSSSEAESSSSSKPESMYRLVDITLNNTTSIPRLATLQHIVTGTKITKSLMPEDINNLPIIELNGDMSAISKDVKVTMDANYISIDNNFSSKATLKIQGATSSTFDKKNYSLAFVDDEGSKRKYTLVDDWGAQSKYCLKANWVDCSHSRNVVSGKIYSEIAHTRDLDDMIGKLPNGGVVDGYPLVMFINGQYHGIYTMNIPKDKWMLGVKDKGKQAIMFTNAWSDRGEFNTTLKTVYDYGWDPEFVSTEDEENGYDWVVSSLNNLITFAHDSSNTEFRHNIRSYLNLERTIDYMIYIFYMCAEDNVSKNINWVTYDGNIWTPSPYDLDDTWGLIWHGQSYYDYSYLNPDGMIGKVETNYLFKRIFNLYKATITGRYNELRKTYLSDEHILDMFSNFYNQIPEVLRTIEVKRWPGIPSTTTNNLLQIQNWSYNRGRIYDYYFK